MERQLGLRNDPDLIPYVIEAVFTGRQLGSGSYGSVEEVATNGLICAGKKIHEILLDPKNEGVRRIAQKYFQECQLMSSLRHPNITQFIGICFLPESQFPVLVMERLDENLDNLLETVPNIPLVLKRSILQDIAQGLVYLHKHTPMIIHRDLTARNVLLTTSFTAKITDFGNSRIVNLQPSQLARTLSRQPGTMAYMPPEALTSSSRYGPSLDIFSFGHLSLFVLNQVFPGDLLEYSFPDPVYPDQLKGRSEVERRGAYFEQLEQSLHRQHHSLIHLTRTCLHNNPSRRPLAEPLVTVLKDVKETIEGPYREFAIFDAIRQVATMKALNDSETKVKEKVDELVMKEKEIQYLQEQLEVTKMQLKELNDELQQKDFELQQKNADIIDLQKELKQVCASKRLFLTTVHQSREKPLAVDTPLQLRWRKGSTMPFIMSMYPHAICLNGKVYIGGGKSTESKQSMQLMVYDPQQDGWSTLPAYVFVYFGMAVFRGHIVLIGGNNPITGETTNQLSTWDDKSQAWQFQFCPSMATPRFSVAVAYDEQRVLVAGGRSNHNNLLSKVEILDTGIGEWHEGPPLPQPMEKMTATIIGNTVILLGGAGDEGFLKQVFTLSLDIPTFIGHLWQTLSDTPFKYSSILAHRGILMAVGGDGDGTSIHIYQPRKRSWEKAGDLPIGRARCACAVLDDGEIFVAGGATPTPKPAGHNLLLPDIALVL